jgi:uncharacterized protein (DUF362 family)
MNRKQFLRTIALAGAAITLKSKNGMDLMAQSQDGQPVDMVAVMGGEPEEMFKQAIEELGGISRFIKKGWKVVIKPNIGWDKSPELAGNTNPKLIGEIVRQCFQAGAKEVTVFDHTCDDWIKCYKNSGIEAAAKAEGAKVVPAHEESYYKEVQLPNAKKLKTTKIHEAILNCDAWINVPVLKHHGGANLSISMKNYMGIVWDRRIFHSSDLQQCIADICTMEKKPALNIVDAYRTMKSNGPQGRSTADVVNTKSLFISTDIVAVDTAAAKFFGQIKNMPLQNVQYLAKGQTLGLGTMDLDKLNIKRIKI